MKILLVFATVKEAEILEGVKGLRKNDGGYQFGCHSLDTCITGVGGMQTAWALKLWLDNNSLPDLAINAGIAGSYRKDILPGDVVMPVSDCFGDLGIEKDNNFFTLSEASLANPDDPPFTGGRLPADNNYVKRMSYLLKPVNAVTVNTASGSGASIIRLINKYNPDIESMEGATFFYICTREKIPFLAIRAISNFVEPGTRGKWEIKLALENLAGKLNEVLNIL
ncbi:MAG TPA: hypothetical protein VMT63_09900 [Bacteroidales bacterium]|nr:hypothetical protein [Bacteroidales bacterium]